MSKIIEKAFEAGKKIVRSIFLGSPNLITTSDLNRQFEAMKYQLDQLDDRTGVSSDFSISASVSSGNLSVSYNYSFLSFKGCEFSPEKKTLSINLTTSAPIAYLCLVADKETVTYDTDASHDIAGAKFEDGTARAAANQIVYKNEAVTLTHSVSGVSNLVGILAIIELSTSGNLVIKNNCINKHDSLSMGATDLVKDLDNTARGSVKNGIPYDRAFSIIENRFTNLCTEWTRFITEDGSAAEGYFRIVNGTLQISKLAEIVIIPEYASRRTPDYYTLGKFPASVETALVNYFNSAGFVDHGRPIETLSDVFIPFADLGSCSVFRAMIFEEGTLTIKFLPAMGFGSMNLILQYGGDGRVSGVCLGFILRHLIQSSLTGEDTPVSYPISGVINLEYGKGSFVYIQRGIYSIPLVGGFN